MSGFKKRNVGKLAEEKAQAFVLHHVRDLIDQLTLQHRLLGSSIFVLFFLFGYAATGVAMVQSMTCPDDKHVRIWANNSYYRNVVIAGASQQLWYASIGYVITTRAIINRRFSNVLSAISESALTAASVSRTSPCTLA